MSDLTSPPLSNASTTALSARGVLSLFRVPFRTAGRLAWIAIVLGVTLRVVDYAKNRPLWTDEINLRANVAGRPIFEFDRPLVHDQLAAPGFLVVARVSSRILGTSSHAIRFVPLFCGIASLFLLRALAERTVSAHAVPVALAIAAFSDDLSYYSSEFKQYSCDLMTSLGCSILALELGAAPLTLRRFLWGVAVGVAATWLSLPAVFVLAGGGIWLAGRAATGRKWPELATLVAMGAIWVASFAGCFVVSSRLLGESPFMWSWWDFAFLPLPPRSLADLDHDFWSFVNVFDNPVGIVTPLGPIGSGLLALGLFLLGGFALAARRRWGALIVLLTPIVLALTASALHRYPFHGRLLLYLVPAFLLPTAEGVAAAGRRCGPVVLTGLVIVLLAAASYNAIERIERHRYRVFDSHGDQRNDLLDHIDSIRNPRIRRAGLRSAVEPPVVNGAGERLSGGHGVENRSDPGRDAGDRRHNPRP